MLKPLFLIAACLIVVGCADSHQVIRGPGSSQQLRLSDRDSIYVSVPVDGVYNTNDPYVGSGLNATRIVQAAFAKKARQVLAGKRPQTLAEARQSAASSQSRFLAFLTILHWEERATEWSGRPDKVELKIELIDAASSELMTSVVLKGRSGLATAGGDHPQDLLPEPADEFVRSLY